jgi:hypothetical protein
MTYSLFMNFFFDLLLSIQHNFQYKLPLLSKHTVSIPLIAHQLLSVDINTHFCWISIQSHKHKLTDNKLLLWPCIAAFNNLTSTSAIIAYMGISNSQYK